MSSNWLTWTMWLWTTLKHPNVTFGTYSKKTSLRNNDGINCFDNNHPDLYLAQSACVKTARKLDVLNVTLSQGPYTVAVIQFIHIMSSLSLSYKHTRTDTRTSAHLSRGAASQCGTLLLWIGSQRINVLLLASAPWKHTSHLPTSATLLYPSRRIPGSFAGLDYTDVVFFHTYFCRCCSLLFTL